MGHPSKEFQAFDAFMGKLLTVPKDDINRRLAEHKERSAANPRKRGPKSKVKPSTS